MGITKSDFLKVFSEFELGRLTTEGINVKTRNLSDAAKEDLLSGIRLLQEVDFDALTFLEKRLELVYQLSVDIHNTLNKGSKIFISGCGATGRLALALESFWRAGGGSDEVFGFMAGGDYALIKSVERFEDRMSYGRRQLEELGFEDGDLLLAVTEGGETSFVIGSALWAAEISSNHPYFLYCNPDEELFKVKRSRDTLEHEGIKKLNLCAGPMALSGSTRMQATTVQMTAIALALFAPLGGRREFMAYAKQEMLALRNLSFAGLLPFIHREAEIYGQNGHVTYACEARSAITLLTDTTERSPTFSLAPFEKTDEEVMGLSYVVVKESGSANAAWEALLGRSPRGLEWPDLDVKIDLEEIYKFDISPGSIERRSGKALLHEVFEILEEKDGFLFRLGGLEGRIPATKGHFVFRQIGLKMALNILSTLIMGRLGRYEGNLMTYVRPSNYKLIDRAARYVLELGKRRGFELEYLQAVEEIFRQIPSLKPDEPVVLKSLEALTRDQA